MRGLAEALGIRLIDVPIGEVLAAYLHTLEPHFEGASRIPPRRTCRRASAATS
jgi:hypothetical protein